MDPYGTANNISRNELKTHGHGMHLKNNPHEANCMHNDLNQNTPKTEQPVPCLTDTDFLVFSAGEHSFGLPYHRLIQILDNPAFRDIPNTPKALRGVIDFRGEAISYYDTRKRSGLQGLHEEIDALLATLKQRKQDHLNWLSKLTQAVMNDEEITVQTNPHKCAFGLWYDNFHPDSPSLRNYLAQFDTPHKIIHSIAIEADRLMREGKKDQALTLIKGAEKNELAMLVGLFDNMEVVIRRCHYEYAIVLEKDGGKIAISADNVDCFGKANEIVNSIPRFSSPNSNNFVKAIGRLKNGNGTKEFFIIDSDKFVDLQ